MPETFHNKVGFLGVQGFYEYINRAAVLEYLKKLLVHEDPNIRAKTCSALGNMCRHSSYFYSLLVSNGKLKLLVGTKATIAISVKNILCDQ